MLCLMYNGGILLTIDKHTVWHTDRQIINHELIMQSVFKKRTTCIAICLRKASMFNYYIHVTLGIYECSNFNIYTLTSDRLLRHV